VAEHPRPWDTPVSNRRCNCSIAISINPCLADCRQLTPSRKPPTKRVPPSPFHPLEHAGQVPPCWYEITFPICVLAPESCAPWPTPCRVTIKGRAPSPPPPETGRFPKGLYLRIWYDDHQPASGRRKAGSVMPQFGSDRDTDLPAATAARRAVTASPHHLWGVQGSTTKTVIHAHRKCPVLI